MTQLGGKVIAVTGAGSGIGRALALELAQRGAHLALSDIDEGGLKQTLALLSAHRSQAKVTSERVDVSDAAAVEAWAARSVAAHGGVDGIINNAGIAVRGSIAAMPYEHFKRVIDVDLWGVVHGVRAFLPHLRACGAGHIVNISSINGMVPFANNGPYNMAKYAVLGLSETLMQELAREPIVITCVHPGGIRTNIVRNAVGMGTEDAVVFDRLARTSAESAAKQIVAAMLRDQPRLYVGFDAKVMAVAKRLVPATAVRVAGYLSSIATHGETAAQAAPGEGKGRRVWIDHTSEFRAPPPEVELLLSDIDGWPAWTPGLLAVRRKRNGPIRVGSSFTLVVKLKGAPPALLPCKVLRLEPGLVEWGGTIGGAEIRHRFEVTALEGERCRVRQLEYATGWLGQLARPFEAAAAAHDRAWSDALVARFTN
jgi:NAD(P)-dependent dehydrogenase (short-subunit alcohol dehydrogenase family)